MPASDNTSPTDSKFSFQNILNPGIERGDMKTMKHARRRVPALLAVATSLLLAATCGCSSAPKEATSAFGDSPESITLHEDVKGKPAAFFPHPVEEVRVAALRALNFVGCETKINKPYHLSGRRPNKFGLLVGSGGETVEVFLKPAAAGTDVWVDTDLSFVGMAGQQGWNDQVLEEMRRILNSPKAATTP